jgi:hypothetical protein
MTLKKEDDHVQLQDPLRIIIKDNGYIEVIRYEEGRISISVYGHAIITNEFLEAMQNSGYRLDRIFNEIDTYSVPENSKEIIIDPVQPQPGVPPFIETIIRFEDTKYCPDLETCCKKCGKQEEAGVPEDDQENEDENAMDHAKLDEDEHSAWKS